MKCHYCQRQYKYIYTDPYEIIPVCQNHLNDHLISDAMNDERTEND